MARYSASAGRQFRQRAEHGARRRIMADSSTAPFWPRDWSTSVRRACRGRPGRIGASTNPASHGRATSAGHAQRGSCFRPGAVAVFALLDDPGFTWLMPIMIAVWGRRPRPDFMVLFSPMATRAITHDSIGVLLAMRPYWKAMGISTLARTRAQEFEYSVRLRFEFWSASGGDAARVRRERQ